MGEELNKRRGRGGNSFLSISAILISPALASTRVAGNGKANTDDHYLNLAKLKTPFRSKFKLVRGSDVFQLYAS